jgi:hypothetical protein
VAIDPLAPKKLLPASAWEFAMQWTKPIFGVKALPNPWNFCRET